MKLHLTYVNRVPKVSMQNKPYTHLTLKAQEYGDKFLSGFGHRSNENWKAGDEVEVAEVKEVVKDGKTYLNFEMPKANGASSGEVLAKLSAMMIGQNEISKDVKTMLREFEVLKPYIIEALGLAEIARKAEPKPAELHYPTQEEEFGGLDNPENQ